MDLFQTTLLIFSLSHNVNLAELNQGDSEQARIELLKCCGSSKWVNNILAARPFSSTAQLHVQAEKIWLELGKDD
ncbi:MAG TPA: hypothetical protein DEA86_00470 [Deltaproteobacteria bacterium]|nr:hypothetical protein [Deltaproteobacteria bacterium]